MPQSAWVMSIVVVQVPALALAAREDFQRRSADAGEYQIHGVDGHRWREGVLQFPCASGTATYHG